jgi:23S rRNA (guanine1835-N2)-methyltransferase
MQQDTLQCATADYTLLRPGAHNKQALRAWDASDEYLINFVSKEHPLAKITLINDQFGALGVALNEQVTCWVSDSYCASQALAANLQKNNKTPLQPLSPLNDWPAEDSIAVMKLPKNLSFLHHLIEKCQQSNISTLLIAGMMKHLPKNILNYLQKFGSVKRHPFVKKSTIYELQLEQVPASIYPKMNSFTGVKLVSHANVFGRDKLDPGADFFLQHLSKIPNAHSVADLCCGSGILGLKYAQTHTDATLDFYDESFMAIESAHLSWQANNLPANSNFYWDDGITTLPNGKYDLILCNPPFHEQFTVGDHIAKRLFKDAQRCLTDNGRIIVVGNRHLGYHKTLTKYFKNVEQIAADSKFVLLAAHA